MAALPPKPENSPTVAAIYAHYVKSAERRKSRRLGGSIIGHACERKLWYDFRWAGDEDFEGRMFRLFETGHREELRIVANLRGIGCEVWYPGEGNESDFEFTAASGHFVNKMDAVVEGLPESPKTKHLGEFKTHSEKSFEKVRKGVRDGKPQHFAQVQVGMELSGLDRALYFAVNKNTDELYAERVHHDKAFAAGLIGKATRVINAKSPGPKLSDNPEHPECKFCSHKSRCHGRKVADVSCRTCIYATPVTSGGDGIWRCERKRRDITTEEQLRGCGEHLFVPELVPYATAVDGSEAENWVEYKHQNGSVFRNSSARHQYKSLELTQLPPELVGAGEVDEGISVDLLKRELGAEVVRVS